MVCLLYPFGLSFTPALLIRTSMPSECFAAISATNLFTAEESEISSLRGRNLLSETGQVKSSPEREVMYTVYDVGKMETRLTMPRPTPRFYLHECVHNTGN
jgi:hypothetical protein